MGKLRDEHGEPSPELLRLVDLLAVQLVEEYLAELADEVHKKAQRSAFPVQATANNDHSPWLTEADVEELTGRKRWSTQCKLLATMGIPFRPNAVGRPLVERSAVLTAPKQNQRPRVEPNWDALRKPSQPGDGARRKKK